MHKWQINGFWPNKKDMNTREARNWLTQNTRQHSIESATRAILFAIFSTVPEVKSGERLAILGVGNQSYGLD